MMVSWWLTLGFHASSAERGGGGNFGKSETYRTVRLLWITDGKANRLMDRHVVGVIFFLTVAMVGMVTSPAAAGCSVV